MCFRHQVKFLECGCFALREVRGQWLQQFVWILCGNLGRGICVNWQPGDTIFYKDGGCCLHPREPADQPNL